MDSVRSGRAVSVSRGESERDARARERESERLEMGKAAFF